MSKGSPTELPKTAKLCAWLCYLHTVAEHTVEFHQLKNRPISCGARITEIEREIGWSLVELWEPSRGTP